VLLVCLCVFGFVGVVVWMCVWGWFNNEEGYRGEGEEESKLWWGEGYLVRGGERG